MAYWSSEMLTALCLQEFSTFPMQLYQYILHEYRARFSMKCEAELADIFWDKTPTVYSVQVFQY